jgi:hypothetical protein
MEKSIQIFTYNENSIEFDMTSKSVMVNATEMAKSCGKFVEPFLRSKETKDFISECLKSDNSRFLGIEKEIDLVNSKQKSGTWMHRILALKFAAWLNPSFELWVYMTIDELLFGAYRALEESLKESAARKNRIEELRITMQESDTYRELERLELEERQAKYSRGRGIKNQLDMFKELHE